MWAIGRDPWRVFSVLICSSLVLAGCSLPFGDDHSGSNQAASAASEFAPAGVVLEAPYPAPDFTLTSHEGEPFQLAGQKGKSVAIFFGYTGCPDVCPLTLSFMAQASDALGSDAENVTFLLITVDPERDDPERLAQYVSRMDASITGLTGDADDLAGVWDDFDITVERREREDGSYLVDHSAQVWLVAPNGELTMFMPMGADGEDLTQGLRWLLDGGV